MKLGLALAGGGVKGAAHIGVLKALEEENIKIDYIGGTSSGSIVATLYAMGFKADEIYVIFKKYCRKIKYVDFHNILRIIFGLMLTGRIIIEGLNSGKQIEKLISKMGRERNIYNISDIEIPLVIPSVDMCKGNVICFTSCKDLIGDKSNILFVNDIEIGKAVRGSCSYPGIFAPCPYKNTKLIDGGIRENVPWKELKLLGADTIINVVFEEDVDTKCCKNLIEVSARAINLICKELSAYEMEGADNIIKVQTSKIGLLDMNRIDELYEMGYKKMKEELVNVKNNYGNCKKYTKS